jgi:hypothetical protein
MHRLILLLRVIETTCTLILDTRNNPKGVRPFTDEYIASSVYAAFGVGVEHETSFLYHGTH